MNWTKFDYGLIEKLFCAQDLREDTGSVTNSAAEKVESVGKVDSPARIVKRKKTFMQLRELFKDD